MNSLDTSSARAGSVALLVPERELPIRRRGQTSRARADERMAVHGIQRPNQFAYFLSPGKQAGYASGCSRRERRNRVAEPQDVQLPGATRAVSSLQHEFKTAMGEKLAALNSWKRSRGVEALRG
jgi:hypothetical protein